MTTENTPPADGTPPADTVVMSADNWREFVPEDLREDPSVAKYSDFGAFVKGHINAVSMIGKDKIVMPETDEQFGELYNRLGRPDTADGYDLKAPKDVSDDQKFDAEFEATLKSTMHTLGLTGKQAQGLNEFLYNTMASATASTSAADEAAKAEALTALRGEYGANVDARVDASMRVIRELGGEPALEQITKDDLLQNPVLVKLFSSIADKVLEETGLEGGDTGSTTASIQEEITTLMSHPAYTDRKHIEHKALVAKVFSLREKLHATAA